MSRHIRVKFCGMTRESDIQQAAALGVDAIGVIFYSGSSRFVPVERARSLLQNVPLFVDVVAVLVNPEPEYVNDILHQLPINYLQFHGEEPPEFCRQFHKPYIKSVAASSSRAIEEASLHYEDAAAILLDTPCEITRGGSGRIFDWSVIPKQTTKPFILAGGLDPDNVLEALNRVSPCALDVCSGIEQSPGVKDHDKMTRFIKALRGNEHE